MSLRFIMGALKKFVLASALTTFFFPIFLPRTVPAITVSSYSHMTAEPPIMKPEKLASHVDGMITSAIYSPPSPLATVEQSLMTAKGDSNCLVDCLNIYKLFIYNHESSNDPKKRNGSGCLGLGQDCSGRLKVACPSLDYQCEDNWFTDVYMLPRYHSWQAAYQFWIRTDPRPYRGHWW